MRWGVPARRIRVVLFRGERGKVARGGIGETKTDAHEVSVYSVQTNMGRMEDGDDFYSHGLCAWCLKVCLTPIYRKRQVEEGNFDCFAKSAGFCDQQACKYREICLRI